MMEYTLTMQVERKPKKKKAKVLAKWARSNFDVNAE
jgi:hypothetical protein